MQAYMMIGMGTAVHHDFHFILMALSKKTDVEGRGGNGAKKLQQ